MNEDFRNQLRQEKEQNEYAYGEYCNRLRAQVYYPFFVICEGIYSDGLIYKTSGA